MPRAFYARPTVEVAHALLGKLLVRRRVAARQRSRVARLVEVEAYLGERDAASHARRGPTPRAEIMFGPPGFLYVYLIYGMHHCMNVVTETDGVAGAVLLRAAAPVAGRRRSRATARPGPASCAPASTSPARDNGLDLTAGGRLLPGRRRRAAAPPGALARASASSTRAPGRRASCASTSRGNPYVGKG